MLLPLDPRCWYEPEQCSGLRGGGLGDIMPFSKVRLQRFPLLSREEIEQSPSRRDGVSWEQESRHQRMAAKKIFDTGIAFKL